MVRIRPVEPADSAQRLALRAALWPDENAAAHRALGFEEVTVLRCFRKALAPEGT
jgi:hypothetical protein